MGDKWRLPEYHGVRVTVLQFNGLHLTLDYLAASDAFQCALVVIDFFTVLQGLYRTCFGKEKSEEYMQRAALRSGLGKSFASSPFLHRADVAPFPLSQLSRPIFLTGQLAYVASKWVPCALLPTKG